MLITVVCVAGCGLVPESGLLSPRAGEKTSQVDGDVPVRPQPRPNDLNIEDTDTEVPQATSGVLGRTVASLGNAAEPGLWLKTPLVGQTRPGKVFLPATGKTANVTLIPIEGPDTAGSRMSLAAMQALGASLTDLIEVDVTAG